MQTELTRIGNDVLKQLDQIVPDGIDISLGTGEWLESVELPDNIVTSAYFFQLYYDLYSLPDFLDQYSTVPGTEQDESIFNHSKEIIHDHNPVDLPGPGQIDKPAEITHTHNPSVLPELSHDNKPVDLIEAIAEYLHEMATSPEADEIKTVHRENFSKPSQADLNAGLNQSSQTTEKTEFEGFSSKTETYKSGIGSFTDLANEFLPEVTMDNRKKDAMKVNTPPGNIRENDSIRETVSDDVLITLQSRQDHRDKIYKPGIIHDPVKLESIANTGHVKKPATLSNVLEKLVQGETREEILELAKVFADLLNKETNNGDPADFHRAIHKVGPQLYDEKNNTLPATGLFPRATETRLFENVDQDNQVYSDFEEPMVTWLKSPEHETQRDKPAIDDLQNVKLYYRRYYGI